MICEAMNWSHLPVAGGIYDQSPQLLDEWQTIWKAKSDVAEEKRAKEERERRAASNRGRAR